MISQRKLPLNVNGTAPRWDQKTERAIGTKEDARSLNFFLDSLILKVNEYKTEIMYSGKLVILNLQTSTLNSLKTLSFI
jgi:hypothetical protein